MKRVLSIALSATLLLQTTMPFAGKAIAAEVKPVSSIQKAESLQQLVSKFKHEVYVEGKNMNSSLQSLSRTILDQQFTISDLQLFVRLNATEQEVAKFNRTLDIALVDVKDMKQLSPEELSFILKNAMVSTSEVGANFMSCGQGMGIGVPLIAVGVIIGIVALVNATASKQLVTKEYIEKRNQMNKDFLNTRADLELEISTYESDIIFYQDEIAELNRRIESGLYGAVEIENMNKTIREYQFKISDANALIGEVNVDLRYFTEKYALDSASLNTEELSAVARVDERRANSGKQAIAAGIAAALGAGFVLAGVSDCN
ncbi:MAG: hypothetical protein ACOVP4_14280 [Bacteriovoracaceae bacterium]|jgi:hypothetical protein